MNISLATLKRLDVVSLLIIAAAAAVYVWPVSVADADSAGAPLPSVPLRAISQPDTLDALRVTRANILSSSRRAPERRYVSPDVASASDYTIPAPFAPPTDPQQASGAAADADQDAVPALYGVVNTDGTWRALLRLSDSDPNPVLLREGDKRGAFRVVSIRSNAVVVAGPSGQRTLRLARPARGDSIGKSP